MVVDPDSTDSSYFTRTSVRDPSVMRHSNSRPTKVLLGRPKEVLSLKKPTFVCWEHANLLSASAE